MKEHSHTFSYSPGGYYPAIPAMNQVHEGDVHATYIIEPWGRGQSCMRPGFETR